MVCNLGYVSFETAVSAWRLIYSHSPTQEEVMFTTCHQLRIKAIPTSVICSCASSD